MSRHLLLRCSSSLISIHGVVPRVPRTFSACCISDSGRNHRQSRHDAKFPTLLYSGCAFGASLLAISQAQSHSFCKEKRLFIVDCGSGHSSAMQFKRQSETSQVEIPLAFIDEFPVLVDALKPGGMGGQAWCDKLTFRLPSDVPVVIGATAGVRQALAKGVIQSHDVEAFRALLKSIPGRNMSFRVLTPLEEAEAEHTAVVACARWSNIVTTDGSRVAMFSGGGKSMQIGVPNDTDSRQSTDYFSYSSDSFVGTALVKQDAKNGLASWSASVKDNILSQRQDASKKDGNFIIIEMLAWAVGSTSVPKDQWVTYVELVSHLTSYIDSERQKLTELPATSITPYILLAYIAQVRCVLETLFDESARFYIPREWVPMKPDFALGLFIDS